MWIAKIKFDSEGTHLGTYATKHNITLYGFPLSYSKGKNCMIVQVAGTIFGSEKSKKSFILELKKSSKIIDLELNGDFLISTVKEPLFSSALYNKDIIHIEPAIISQKGYELLTLGSFNREKINILIRLLKDKRNGKLISITNKKINSISIMKVSPELTAKQRAAMDLAIMHGYYQCPRKINLVTLAKISKLSFSTYQVHLRKAEQKIIPNIFS